MPVNKGYVFDPLCNWNDYRVYTTAQEAKNDLNEWCDGCGRDDLGYGCWKGDAVNRHVAAIYDGKETLKDVPSSILEHVKNDLRLRAIDEADW